MLVLSSPSGAGKTTISRALIERQSDITVSVSATTRPMRLGEVDGVDYHFIDQSRFDRMILSNEFYEHAMVFGNSYGTPRQPVIELLSEGQDVLFDVDWQGTQQIRLNALEDLVSIFILPPSIEELEKRLRSRAQDSEDVLRRRMAMATLEMSHWDEYQYVIINDDFENSVSEIEAILTAERLKRDRQIELVEVIRQLGAS